ncbi:MAG: ribbon-helix-helix protein, CopG family [Coriobacteriia bacterium]|nr:ribbon-helix-helix protein, CopG family [Coriobacteriia bacterium]
MAVEKITISLPASLVSEIDRLSAEEGVSRSHVVREAAALYVSDREAAREVVRKRSAAREVLAMLDELRGRVPADGRPVLDILREARGPLDDEAVR